MQKLLLKSKKLLLTYQISGHLRLFEWWPDIEVKTTEWWPLTLKIPVDFTYQGTLISEIYGDFRGSPAFNLPSSSIRR